MSNTKIQVFAWSVFFIVLLTVILSLYVDRFNPFIGTNLIPFPEAETVVGDVWDRLEIDFRSGKNNIILAFVHIQKTGGKSLVKSFLSVQKRGNPLCYMIRNITNDHNYMNSGRCYIDLPKSKEMWFVSETTYGWPCGAHPLLLGLKSCLPKLFLQKYGGRPRSFQFLTLIRHPVIRFISEFYHVSSFNGWLRSYLCNGKKIVRDMRPSGCIHRIKKGVTFEDFMSCSDNWAINRQTLMLADVDKAGCLNQTVMSTDERNSILLATAKQNLKDMIYFGVTEYITESILLLEHRLDIEFGSPLIQPLINELNIADHIYEIWNNSNLYKKISSVNYLDMQLYEYGLKLFDQRLRQIHINIDFQKTDKDIFRFMYSAETSNDFISK